MIETPPNMVSGKKTSRLAIVAAGCAVAAVVLTLLDLFECTPLREGFLFVVSVDLLGPLAFILAIIAIIVIAFKGEKLKGKWYAVAAIFLSLPFILAMASAIFVNRNRAEGKKTGDGQVISRALIRYAKDHNGYLPDANQWCDLVVSYDNERLSKIKFKYDSSKDGVCNYAFNRNLSGARLDNISYNTVLVFESEGKWNLSGTEELFEKTPRKRQYVYVYTKDVETGENFPREINTKDADYEQVLWKSSYRKQ